MNPVNLKKLLNSKWTAVQPSGKEKHFVIVGWTVRSPGVPEKVALKSIFTGNSYLVPWRELKETSRWIVGWA